MMKVLLLLSAVAVTVFASTEASQAQLHRRATSQLNNIVDTFPPSVNLVQLHAQILMTPIAAGLDELATLLFKMQKDITIAKKAALATHIKVQGDCDRKRFRLIQIKNAETTKARKFWKSYNLKKDQRQSVPAKWQEKQRRIGQLRNEIKVGEDNIAQAEKARVEAYQLYLQNIADFNKALDDVDMLRTLVETKLTNRGQGSDNDVRHTMNPTQKGEIATFSPTVKGEVFKGHHAHEFAEERTTKFLEVASNDELATMSTEEAAQAMKGIYTNLRSSNRNPTINALVNTLDSTMIQVQSGDTSAVDKIRDLLIQVRDELQKSKRLLTKEEIKAVNAHQTALISLYAQNGDLKIDTSRLLIEIAELKTQYGTLWKWEAYWRMLYHRHHMGSKITATKIEYHNYLCTVLRNKFMTADEKRVKQLESIKAALEIIFKLKEFVSEPTRPKINSTLNDVTINMCRQFTKDSAWVSVANAYTFPQQAAAYSIPKSSAEWADKEAPQDALKIYNDVDANQAKYACISKWRFEYTCTKKCDIRFGDKRLPRDAWSTDKSYKWASHWPRVALYTKDDEFNHRQKSEVRLGVPMKYNPNHATFKDFVADYQGDGSVVRQNIEVFVVPGCNCNPLVNKDYIVDPNWKV